MHLFLVRRIQAWSGDEVQRLVSSSKLHFLDSGLLASTLRLATAGLAIDRTAFGPVLESFVYSELIKSVPYTHSHAFITFAIGTMSKSISCWKTASAALLQRKPHLLHPLRRMPGHSAQPDN
jgi:predicted AAA+ superfamily ATPase